MKINSSSAIVWEIEKILSLHAKRIQTFESVHQPYAASRTWTVFCSKRQAKLSGKSYTLVVFENGGTKRQLLARSQYLLFESADKWTQSQKHRAKVLFEQFPDLKKAYSMTHSLRMIFTRNTSKDSARLALVKLMYLAYLNIREKGMIPLPNWALI